MLLIITSIIWYFFRVIVLEKLFIFDFVYVRILLVVFKSFNIYICLLTKSNNWGEKV